MALLVLLAGACAGTKVKNNTGSGASSGAGGAGGAGTPGTGGSQSTGSGNTGGACQTLTVSFEPKTPTVFVLVDRSGSEFTTDTTGVYFTLRSAVLDVIQGLQSQVRFGLGVFVGGQAPLACPTFDSVPTDINNYAAIAAKYNGLGKPTVKAETPAVQVIPMVRAALAADGGNGQKYMLFVTDSESDFCDDGSPLCPADAVTHMIQDMHDVAGFGTLVIGLPTSISAISPAVLQNFANAGAGLPVINPPNSGAATLQDIFYQCQGAGNGAWMTLWRDAGRTGTTPLATYMPAGANAPVYSPTSATSKDALTAQIAAALADVKSCTFDLTGHIKVDLTQLNKAGVKIQGQDVPLSDSNGWHMVNDTQLELVGTFCDSWRDPMATMIEFDFPCELIIPT